MYSSRHFKFSASNVLFSQFNVNFNIKYFTLITNPSSQYFSRALSPSEHVNECVRVCVCECARVCVRVHVCVCLCVCAYLEGCPCPRPISTAACSRPPAPLCWGSGPRRWSSSPGWAPGCPERPRCCQRPSPSADGADTHCQTLTRPSVGEGGIMSPGASTKWLTRHCKWNVKCYLKIK